VQDTICQIVYCILEDTKMKIFLEITFSKILFVTLTNVTFVKSFNFQER